MQNYQAPENLLQDRIILVTGAGDGIGRAAALAYAKRGATLILLGKSLANLEALYDEIEESGSAKPAIFPMNLETASEREFEGLGITLLDTFGHLDGILHSAASMPYLSRIKDYDQSDWMKIMQINLNAPFAITQSCLPLLLESDDASVIFTSDSVAQKGKAYWGPYAAAKAGQDRLMEVLADEMESSPIRFNSIDPGPTRTKFRRNLFPGEDMTQTKAPEKLLPLYLWLMGPDSKGYSGERFVFQ